MTFTVAIDHYFGGIHVLSKAKFPFTCIKCGGRDYPKKVDGKVVQHPILSTQDCFWHIRKVHKEKINYADDTEK